MCVCACDFLNEQCQHTQGLWNHWSTWPGLTCTMDLGSDGVCAAHCLIFLWFCNMIIWPDGSHGAARDFALLLGAMNLKSFWLFMVCVWNLPFGHDKHVDGRYYQLRSATADFFKTQHPGESVLWHAFGGYIHNELKALGVEFQWEKPRSIETFEHQKQHPQTKREYMQLWTVSCSGEHPYG